MTQTWDFRDCGGNARVRIQYNFPSFFVQTDFHLLVWYPGRNDLMRHLSSLTTRKPQDGMNTPSPRQRTMFEREQRICVLTFLQPLLKRIATLFSRGASSFTFPTLTHNLAKPINLSTTPSVRPDQSPTQTRPSEDVNTNDPSAWSARPHGHLRPAHQRHVFHAHPPPRPHAPRGGFWGRALWILHRWWALVQGSTGEERQEWDPETAVDCEDYFRSE